MADDVVSNRLMDKGQVDTRREATVDFDQFLLEDFFSFFRNSFSDQFTNIRQYLDEFWSAQVEIQPQLFRRFQLFLLKRNI